MTIPEAMDEGTSSQRAMMAYIEDEDIRDLCEANGLSREDFLNNRFGVQFLEYFLQPCINMNVFHWFPALRELQVMHCSIERIQGLDRCPNLEKLWLNENNLQVIEGLSRCTKLKELYLYSNELTSMQGLENLVELEVLWLMENKIRQVEGLENCRKLRELSLASNLIESIGGRLDNQLLLEELNVAGNHIGSFQDIPYLDRLPLLRSISFADPHFGSNPICQLCNYQTYTIYHLRRITKLDCLVINEDQRHLAEATFMKKKMYYNMRIKTLKRNTTNLLKKGLLFKQSKKSEISAHLPALHKKAKLLKHQIYELENGMSGSPEVPVGYLREQLQEVNHTLEQKREELNEVEQRYAEMRMTVQGLSVHQISRFMVELQTGGNIRLEEGKASDMWYKSCVDLVKSRFYTADFEALGLKDVKVIKVTRIHNRFLRNRFDDHLSNFLDPTDAVAKRALEYLFYGEDLEVPGEMLRALQHGFRHASDYEALGKDGGVPLSNSVYLCEEARLKDQLKTHNSNNPGRKFDALGHFLICKVYLGNAAQEVDQPVNFTSSTLIASSNDPVKLRRDKYGDDVNCVYRCRPGDTKQRMWFIFDHFLVLPEYLVECVYEPIAPLGGTVLAQDVEELNSVIAKLTGVRSDVDLMDMKVFAYPFVSFMQACNMIASSSQDLSSVAQQMSQGPSQATDLTFEVIQKVANCYDTTRLPYLNLLGRPVKSLAPLFHLRALRTLVAAFVGLTRIEGIAGLPCLERLDLSFNELRKIEGLENLPSLTSLELNDNLLHRLDDLDVLSQCLPKLLVLNLAGNNICETKGYTGIVLQLLPALEQLDGCEVSSAAKEMVGKPQFVITEEVLLAHVAFQLGSQWSNSLAPIVPSAHDGPAAGAYLTIADSLDDGLGEDATRISQPLPTPVTQKYMQLGSISSLNLSRLRIQKMENLEGLRNLRRLNMSDNEITRIEGLEACCKLEELCLEDNRIHRIEGLQCLPHLRKLELGKNKITNLQGLQANMYLCQISLEDNDITSLHGLEHMVSLMELYLNNNKVESVKEANHLRDLDKLIILDLSGNPMCKDPEYRLYTIYQLKKLKVLDGISIDVTENSLAKETFTGKMTPELLAERAGSSLDWGTVTELNLSHCGLKEISLIGQFRSLAILKVDHNLLSDLKGLENCIHLHQLDLSFNRFKDGLDVKDPPQRNPLGRYLLNMAHLEALFLDGNGVQTISSLQLQLPSLRCLSLRQNDVSKFGGLESIPNLQLLVLDKNKVRCFDPSALAPVASLTELRLEENHIRSLEGLNTLQNLKRLSLVSNRIAEPSEVDHIENLQDLEEVWLTSNSIARKPHYRYSLIHKFPKLVHIDGKEVTAEERERAIAFYAQYTDPLYHQGSTGIPASNVFYASQPAQQQISSAKPTSGAVKVSVLSLLPDNQGPIAIQGLNGKAGPAARGRLSTGRGASVAPNVAIAGLDGMTAGARRRGTGTVLPSRGSGVNVPSSAPRNKVSPRPSSGGGKPNGFGRL